MTPGHDPRRHRSTIASQHRVKQKSIKLSQVIVQAQFAAELVGDTGADALAFAPRRRWEGLNRTGNLILAAIAVVVASPVMLLVALAVGTTSRGGVLYRQRRVGIDRRAKRTAAVFDRRASDVGGNVFTIYKFRTMVANAESATGAVWASRNDPRCTPIGAFLRKSRLDELPQLFNVLRGDMNIVGPRPERPSIFQSLRADIPEYHLRQRTKPGITGWAQVNHDYDATIEDVRTKVRYDLEYLARQSMWEDIKIMLRTIPVMVFRRGGW
jgi:lipopolysaccharide/colanic/teichoic acid biosynthesis glycosyltransferase